MNAQPPTGLNGGNRKGTPAGQGTIVPAHGGRIGNPPFVPTEEQRQKVRQYAKAFPVSGERFIARLIGISRETLRKYFEDELELGRAEMLAAIGAQMVNRAIDAEATTPDGKPIAKGDLDAQKYVLARLGGWSTRVEHSGPDGGPIETKVFDLSGLSIEEQKALLPIIDQLLIQAGAEEGEFVEVEDGTGDAASSSD